MRKKIIIVILSFAAVLLFILAVCSYGMVKKKLELKSGNQNTIDIQDEKNKGESVQAEGTQPDSEAQKETSGAKPVKENTQDQTDTQEDASGTESSLEEEGDLKEEVPVITLYTDRVEIKAGEPFDELSPVEDVSDNKDSKGELFRRIRVRGEYDIYTPGEYTLQYFVIDSEEYQSKIRELKLIVTAG